ncbi:hypothetical protein SB861_14680 [Paraburkholderia sp. SIMBA_049]
MSADHNALLEALTRLCDAGVKLSAWPDGWPDANFPLELSAAGAIDYAHDPDKFMARHYGVSVAELTAWRDADGMYQCHAITRKGKRCRHPVEGTLSRSIYNAERDLAKWAREDARVRYCTLHARAAHARKGEPS